jgi:hypothetical protein
MSGTSAACRRKEPVAVRPFPMMQPRIGWNDKASPSNAGFNWVHLGSRKFQAISGNMEHVTSVRLHMYQQMTTSAQHLQPHRNCVGISTNICVFFSLPFASLELNNGPLRAALRLGIREDAQRERHATFLHQSPHNGAPRPLRSMTSFSTRARCECRLFLGTGTHEVFCGVVIGAKIGRLSDRMRA